jgi:hypothetical protein
VHEADRLAAFAFLDIIDGLAVPPNAGRRACRYNLRGGSLSARDVDDYLLVESDDHRLNEL